MLDALRATLAGIVGAPWVSSDPVVLDTAGRDALKRGHRPDLVVTPGTTAEVAAIARACHDARVPMTVRGAGTGYTGGAVPIRGGLVIAMSRFNRILEVDAANLLAVVQPNVITRALHTAVEAQGLFYPPDPASLAECAIGGNVAECAGGPRAFKYGTTRRYVLALEAVLPTGEILRTGSRTVKNVTGYALTDLLVGSEGTLAIITEITLRLVPKPAARHTFAATYPTIDAAARAVGAIVAAGVIPATLELIDAASLDAVAAHLGRSMAPPGTAALLLAEVDGGEAAALEEARLAREACAATGATSLVEADTDEARAAVWEARRELSYALRRLAPRKINHDVVVPRGRVPELYGLIDGIRARHGLVIAAFGHAGDGNIHVNLMVDPANHDEMRRASAAERELFAGVVALDGAISGEHGIGYAKAQYLGLQLSAAEIALMARLKHAFDPHGVLNPGKMWETTPEDLRGLSGERAGD
ncbi:MAG: FAD-binding protein [Acidobacteria bacterium]|nr:FAD-binding protein [Acidobacteriota bacterium]